MVPLSTLYGTMNMSQLLLGACSSQKEERILHALGYVLADKVWIESLEVETEKCLQLMSNWRSTLENSVNISEDNLHKDLGEKTFQGGKNFFLDNSLYIYVSSANNFTSEDNPSGRLFM